MRLTASLKMIRTSWTAADTKSDKRGSRGLPWAPFGFLVLACLVSGCGDRRVQAEDVAGGGAQRPQLRDGPSPGKPLPHARGDATRGRETFRFETFGNEGFWTDAMRMSKGILDAKVTPLDALKVGLIVDIDAVPADLREQLARELKTDMSPTNAPLLHDVKTTVRLIEANAVVGIVPKDSNGDGKINLSEGDKVGVSCAICHTISDKSVFDLPGAGSIGRRIDGPAALTLNVGKLLATGANSRAGYPNLQLVLGGSTIGRAPTGLRADSTEAEVDAYLTNPSFYPVGTFDETQDGIGNPVVNTPLFRQDLAAPYGSAGEHAVLDDIGNASYTSNLDPTNLLSPEGRAFLKMKAGPLGEELASNYERILRETGVTGYPYVTAAKTGKLVPASPVGLRVDNQKLLDMNAYIDDLQAPKGALVDERGAARGREVFRSSCTACHNVDQGKPVPTTLVPLATLLPDYRPKILLVRTPPLTPVTDSPGIFDDKMIVVDASDRGEIRGNALPLLLDLDRKRAFLHDASVPSLEALLSPSRGAAAPHPFYVVDEAQRKDVVLFLRAADTTR